MYTRSLPWLRPLLLAPWAYAHIGSEPYSNLNVSNIRGRGKQISHMSIIQDL